jgi:GNAT superfamily N-acetyltransferase
LRPTAAIPQFGRGKPDQCALGSLHGERRHTWVQVISHLQFVRWREMTRADIPGLMSIAAVVHPSYPENEAVFAERLSLFPVGCRTLVGVDGRLHGYIVSHPWRDAAQVPLNTLLVALPLQPTALYLHDLALLPTARGTGAAGEVVRYLLDLARGLALLTASLVAVSGSVGFWGRQGFEAGGVVASRDMQGYGDDAVFMVRSLATH